MQFVVLESIQGSHVPHRVCGPYASVLEVAHALDVDTYRVEVALETGRSIPAPGGVQNQKEWWLLPLDAPHEVRQRPSTRARTNTPQTTLDANAFNGS